MEDTTIEDAPPNIDLETPPSLGSDSAFYVPPSVDRAATLAGESHEYFSPVPAALLPPSPGGDGSGNGSAGVPCILGVDEAGRGPVLGPMVYGVFYLPAELSTPLLKEKHHFDDSKVLTPAVRTQLMRELCTPPSPSPSTSQPQPHLHTHTGFATASLSARSISSGMLRPAAQSAYNLNAQALDATASLIRGVLARGVAVREVYVDTVGPPAAHQARLERLFPTCRFTVTKKADSLFPCVSAASVCAKVTRDAALEVLYEGRRAAIARAAARMAEAAGVVGSESGREKVGGKRKRGDGETEGGEGEGQKAEKEKEAETEEEEPTWGSGYPSDARCTAWLRRNMHPVFGWGPECRFSWGTAKDMIEAGGGKGGVRVEWPVADEEGDESHRVTDFFAAASDEKDGSGAAADELGSWFGTPVEAF
ncbi:hypothetical protein SLS62_005699 [Diatrype stigma]|uniref:Ribonuclease n=1 Tax=Diatrype stigma TaxID=117547 RepID=A0AAN9US80_9PEZI